MDNHIDPAILGAFYEDIDKDASEADRFSELLDQTFQHGLKTISSDDLPDGLSKKAAKEHLTGFYKKWKEEHEDEFEDSCTCRVIVLIFVLTPLPALNRLRPPREVAFSRNPMRVLTCAIPMPLIIKGKAHTPDPNPRNAAVADTVRNMTPPAFRSTLDLGSVW